MARSEIRRHDRLELIRRVAVAVGQDDFVRRGKCRLASRGQLDRLVVTERLDPREHQVPCLRFGGRRKQHPHALSGNSAGRESPLGLRDAFAVKNFHCGLSGHQGGAVTWGRTRSNQDYSRCCNSFRHDGADPSRGPTHAARRRTRNRRAVIADGKFGIDRIVDQQRPIEACRLKLGDRPIRQFASPVARSSKTLVSTSVTRRHASVP